MQSCLGCGAEFSIYPVIDGERTNLRGRQNCTACQPQRRLLKPRKKVARTPHQKTCESCGARFPAKLMIDGVTRDLHRRRFCLRCSPFGTHNTSKVAPGSAPEDRERSARARRLASWLRYGRTRRRQRKRDLVAAFGGKCIDCGYARAVAALEFHHRDATTKDFGIAKFNGSDARLMAEATKCELLCANCHRIRHAVIDAFGDPAASSRRRLKERAVRVLGGRCEGCDRLYTSVVFEFHHLDAGNKEFGISEDGVIRRWDEIAAELAKCVLLCANCHREVHVGSRDIDNGLLGLAEENAVYEVAASQVSCHYPPHV